MTPSTDRMVHARRAGGPQVVRYDRAGKWYLEWQDGRTPRQQISISRAVDEALMAEHEKGGEVFLERAGGQAFDSAFRRRSGKI